MNAADISITASSVLGRVLLALRAGPMSSAEINERVPSAPSMRGLQRLGYISGDDDGWQITDVGRAVCPLRNPVARVVQKPLVSAPIARSVAAIGLPMKTATQTPFRRSENTEITGGKDMQTVARSQKITNTDAVRQMLLAAPSGVARKELIKRTGLKPSVIDTAIFNLITAGEVERKGYGMVAATPSGISVITARLDQASALATAVAEQAATTPHPAPSPLAVQESAAPAPFSQDTPEIDFMIHDDGRLSIRDGNEVLVLPPDATRRLCRFLDHLEPLPWIPHFDSGPIQPQPIA